MLLSKSKKIGYLVMVFISFMVYFAVAKPVNADNYLSKTERSLNIISNFANKICYDIQQSGGELKWEIEGGASAELRGLIKKLADLKIQGAAKYTKTEYQGVLQKDLANALKNSADCKLTIFRELKVELLKIEPKPDDHLYTYDLSERIMRFREQLKETKVPLELTEATVSVYILGSFSQEVVRYGEKYKGYRSPIFHLGEDQPIQLLATPSAEYYEQGEKCRRVSIEFRRGEGTPWESSPDDIYLWQKGDWVRLSEL